MPNAWGQPHPWEEADLSQTEWVDVMRYTIKRWVTASDALSEFYEKGGPMTRERFDEMKREEDQAVEEHRAVMRGDRVTCWEIWEKLHPVVEDR